MKTLELINKEITEYKNIDMVRIYVDHTNVYVFSMVDVQYPVFLYDIEYYKNDFFDIDTYKEALDELKDNDTFRIYNVSDLEDDDVIDCINNKKYTEMTESFISELCTLADKVETQLDALYELSDNYYDHSQDITILMEND